MPQNGPTHFRSSHRRCSVKTPEASNFIKKETLAQAFSCEFGKISKNIFFTEQLMCLFLYSQLLPFYLLSILILLGCFWMQP